MTSSKPDTPPPDKTTLTESSSGGLNPGNVSPSPPNDNVDTADLDASGAAALSLQTFRNRIVAEILAMSRHLTGGNKVEAIGAKAAVVLGTLDRGQRPVMEDLLVAHSDLKALVAPAAPHALLSNNEQIDTAGYLRILGPNPIVRHLTLANIFFLLLFFGISLRPEINMSTLNLSIYEQTGFPLFIKLVFLVAAAGLGASFGALFDVWDSIKSYTFDPPGDSAHWMKVCLGIVAGLALTEIFQGSVTTANSEGSTSDALTALVGGFSASLLHVALSRTTNAVKSIFAPADQG